MQLLYSSESGLQLDFGPKAVPRPGSGPAAPPVHGSGIPARIFCAMERGRPGSSGHFRGRWPKAGWGLVGAAFVLRAIPSQAPSGGGCAGLAQPRKARCPY